MTWLTAILLSPHGMRRHVSVFSIRYNVIARPSVVCLWSVTLVRSTQAVQIFGNISTALGILAILDIH